MDVVADDGGLAFEGSRGVEGVLLWDGFVLVGCWLLERRRWQGGVSICLLREMLLVVWLLSSRALPGGAC